MRQGSVLLSSGLRPTRYLTNLCTKVHWGRSPLSGRDYFAWQDGHLIGTYQTFEKAMERLAWKERLKKKPNVLEARAAVFYPELTRETGW
jgi:hypothetical protein